MQPATVAAALQLHAQLEHMVPLQPCEAILEDFLCAK